MPAYPSARHAVSPNQVFELAAQHCQNVFPFRDAVVCTAAMLWHAVVWAAGRGKSLAHAVDRFYPEHSDQTFWNLLRRHLPKQVPALERRLNELLRLPFLLPQLAGRSLVVAVDYHLIPYYGAPKKVDANCDAASPNAAPPASTLTPPSASWSPVGGTPWR